MQQTGSQQLLHQKTHATGGVEVVHIGAAVGVHAGQQRHHGGGVGVGVRLTGMRVGIQPGNVHQVGHHGRAGLLAALARADSDDKASGARGGDLGWVMPGMLVPQFEQEMDRLQPGEISPPFQTPFGWHIVQVLERRQVQGGADSERARIREALFRRRADEEWDLQLRRLRDEAYVEIRLPPATAAP